MKTLLVMLVIVLMTVGGCANHKSLNDAVLQAGSSGKEGVSRIYSIPDDQAWRIAAAVFRWMKVDTVEEHRPEKYLLASSGMQMAAFGTVMGVWIEPVEPNATRVTVVSRNRGDCCALTDLTPERFFERFERGVEIVQRGEKLPVVPPEAKE